MKLRRKGLGYRRIRRKIKELYNVALSTASINYWCRGIHTPFGGIRICMIDHLEPSPELAYVIGVVSGDGYAVKLKTKNGDYRLERGVRDREFDEEFSKCLGRVLGRDPPKPIPLGDGRLKVRVRSKAMYELLQRPVNLDRIKYFTEYSEDCARSFLRGFFDSEGS